MYAAGAAWEPLAIGLRAPTSAEVAARYAEVQAWLAAWQSAAARRLRIETSSVGGRLVGANDLPRRVWVDSYDQLWALLSAKPQVGRLDDVLATTRAAAPDLVDWVVSHPLKALAVAEDWPSILAVVDWVTAIDPTVTYVRQVDAPGADTKFVDRHRLVIGELLDQRLPADRIDAEHPRSDFVRRYRFLRRPAYVRLRFLDPADGTARGVSELTYRADELAAAPIDAPTVFVVENETTFLAFPDAAQAIVIFGGGYAVSTLQHLPWLRDRDVMYWGDLDTHGFAILDRVREFLPAARSMLMDRETLLAHRGQWVVEPVPTQTPLTRLTVDEAALYRDLVEAVYGPAVRLEQERIRFSWLVSGSSAAEQTGYCGT